MERETLIQSNGHLEARCPFHVPGPFRDPTDDHRPNREPLYADLRHREKITLLAALPKPAATLAACKLAVPLAVLAVPVRIPHRLYSLRGSQGSTLLLPSDAGRIDRQAECAHMQGLSRQTRTHVRYQK